MQGSAVFLRYVGFAEEESQFQQDPTLLFFGQHDRMVSQVPGEAKVFERWAKVLAFL